MEASVVEIPGYIVGRWTIDPVHSYLGYVVRHMLVGRLRGHFTKFEGEIVTAENPLDSTASISIDMSSISTYNDFRDGEVRGDEFFAVDEHPTMTFKSTRVREGGKGFIIDGDLTLRGVTKPLSLDVELGGFGPDSMGGTRCGFSATGEIDRKEFGVKYDVRVPGGGLAVSDKVQLALEVEGVLQT